MVLNKDYDGRDIQVHLISCNDLATYVVPEHVNTVTYYVHAVGQIDKLSAQRRSRESELAAQQSSQTGCHSRNSVSPAQYLCEKNVQNISEVEIRVFGSRDFLTYIKSQHAIAKSQNENTKSLLKLHFQSKAFMELSDDDCWKKLEKEEQNKKLEVKMIELYKAAKSEVGKYKKNNEGDNMSVYSVSSDLETIQKLEEKLTNLNDKLNRALSKIENLRSANEDLTFSLTKDKNDNATIKRELEEKLKKNRSKVQDLEKKVEELNKVITGMSDEAKKNLSHYEDIVNENESLKKQMLRKEQKYEKELNRERKNKIRATTDLQKLETELKSANDKVKRLQGELTESRNMTTTSSSSRIARKRPSSNLSVAVPVKKEAVTMTSTCLRVTQNNLPVITNYSKDHILSELELHIAVEQFLKYSFAKEEFYVNASKDDRSTVPLTRWDGVKTLYCCPLCGKDDLTSVLAQAVHVIFRECKVPCDAHIFCPFHNKDYYARNNFLTHVQSHHPYVIQIFEHFFKLWLENAIL